MEIANAHFKRKSPAAFAERVELPSGWMVLRFDHLTMREGRRTTHGHWVAMVSGSNKIYRIVRYSVTLPKSSVVLDWTGWIDLQGRIADLKDKIPIMIRTPHLWEYPIIPFRHVDPGYRMAAWLGHISVALAVLPLVISGDLKNIMGA